MSADLSSKILRDLRARRNPRNIAGMKRFGIVGRNRLGVSMPVLRSIAREAGISHDAAMRLWASDIPEAMIVASMVEDPEKVSIHQLERWVLNVGSWDVCDQLCLNLLRKTPFAWRLVRAWARREEEFVRRAAFALLACLAVHDPESDDTRFERTFPIIRRAASDERNFVRKAVSWALRSIGKRNAGLRISAVRAARALLQSTSPSARWIGADAIRELSALRASGRRHS